jgi:hypothetical protein
MLLGLRVSLFTFILCLNVGVKDIIASERKENNYLLSNQTDRQVKLGQGIRSKSEILSGNIDNLAKKFEHYESLSEKEQKELREKYKDEVQKLVNYENEMKIEKYSDLYFLRKDSTPIEELEMPDDSKNKLRRIQNLYPRSKPKCIVF